MSTAAESDLSFIFYNFCDLFYKLKSHLQQRKRLPCVACIVAGDGAILLLPDSLQLTALATKLLI